MRTRFGWREGGNQLLTIQAVGAAGIGVPQSNFLGLP